MNCNNCGKSVSKSDKYCASCGENLINPKKKISPVLIAFIVIFILVVIPLVFIILMISIIYYSYKSGDFSEQKVESTINEKFKEETRVNYEGFTFTLPSYATMLNNENNLLISAYDNKIVLALVVKEANFEKLKDKKEELKSIIESSEEFKNYDLSEMMLEEKEYLGMPFIIIKNVKDGDFNIEITYSKASEDKVFVSSITKTDNTLLTESEKRSMLNIIASGKSVYNPSELT